MKRIKVIKAIIYITMLTIAIMAVPNAMFNFSTSKVMVKWIYLAMQIVIIPLTLEIILYEFLKIIKAIELKDTFNWSNVERFRRISYCVWSIVLMKVIINVIRTIKGDDIDLIYILIVALFTQILSRVFLEAYKLKKTEERLKEESELII